MNPEKRYYGAADRIVEKLQDWGYHYSALGWDSEEDLIDSWADTIRGFVEGKHDNLCDVVWEMRRVSDE